MTLTPLDHAQRLVLDACTRLHPTAVPLAEALGCVTSLEIVAEESVPGFDNSAMDGYAVHAADTRGASESEPVRLRTLGTRGAGVVVEDGTLGRGEALRIMTGAPMPPGADAVVMVERSSVVDEETVALSVAVEPGASVRRAGDDLRAGEVAIEASTELGAGHLGMLASLGVRRVPVYRTARVGVMSTGDELVDGPGPLRLGQIRDSNRPTLMALVSQAGCEAVDLGCVGDDEGMLSEVITRGAATCDALLTSGGVSMGDFDLVKVVLDRLGEMTWMQVAVKPAKPFAFGLIETPDTDASGAPKRTPVFGLPGNPVSSMVSFELFVRPAVRKMMGHSRLHRPVVRARATRDLERRVDGKTHFVRVLVGWDGDGFEVTPASGQGSHQLSSMAGSNGLVVLPDGEGARSGDLVETMLLTCDTWA